LIGFYLQNVFHDLIPKPFEVDREHVKREMSDVREGEPRRERCYAFTADGSQLACELVGIGYEFSNRVVVF
jgi:hypothetical protein